MIKLRPHKISFKTTTGGGFDVNRIPLPVVPSWTEPIPCRYETEGKSNIKTLSDGTFKSYPYVVFLGPSSEDYTARFVKLFDEFGNIVIEGQIQHAVRY